VWVGFESECVMGSPRYPSRTRPGAATGIASHYRADTASFPLGQTILGRLAQATIPDGMVTTLSYDDIGDRSRSTSTMGGESFSVRRHYDAVGRLNRLQ